MNSRAITSRIPKVFFLVSLLLVSGVAYAGDYVPLVGLPGANPSPNQDLSQYFNKLYMLIVAVGAIIAFLKIALAGAKWSLSEIVTDKSDAKRDIQGALLGLAILLIPFIVLNTIYSGLTDLNVLSKSSQIRGVPARGTTLPGGGVPPINNVPGPGEQMENMSCIVRGTLIAGSQDELGGPRYTDDSYDCTQKRTECLTRQGARPVVSANGQTLSCIFTPTACTPGSPGCSITPAPNYTPVNENFACASASNCSAAIQQCRNLSTYMNVSSPFTEGGVTKVRCEYRQNTTPVTTPDPGCFPTPESPC